MRFWLERVEELLPNRVAAVVVEKAVSTDVLGLRGKVAQLKLERGIVDAVVAQIEDRGSMTT